MLFLIGKKHWCFKFITLLCSDQSWYYISWALCMIQMPPFSQTILQNHKCISGLHLMRMHDTKCKHKAGFHVNVSLAPKSVLKVAIHDSMHSILELMFILRTRFHNIHVLAKHKVIQWYCPKPRASQVCSFEGQFCQSFNTW